VSNLRFWLGVGFFGQAFFTARFLVQWVASEKRCDSVVPRAFWWLSVLGGTALLAYAIFRRDPVIVAGQALGLLVYVRNLILVGRARCRTGQDKVRLVRSVSSVSHTGGLGTSPETVTSGMETGRTRNQPAAKTPSSVGCHDVGDVIVTLYRSTTDVNKRSHTAVCGAHARSSGL
jgi:lipid-A-disaccharide synthase-like uncharacterized protein